MAHKTLNRNTTIVVYKFGARPLAELPDEFWRTAKQMQSVWNDLVQMRNKLTENFERLGISGKDKVKERVQYWKEFDKIWREYLKSESVKTQLGSDEREFLTQKFETADKRAKKEKTGLKKQFSLDRVYFRHRFSGGGLPLEKFQRMSGDKFNFDFPPADVYYTNAERKRRAGGGVFGVLKDREAVFTFPFSAVIHREIPKDAIVKSVSWTGKRLKNQGLNKKHLPESMRDWIWSIDIAVEVPQIAENNLKSGRIAALDVGWRKIDNNFLRIGAILDTDGNRLELLCPVSCESNSARHGKLVSSIGDLIELDETIGDLIQETKDRLTESGVKNLLKMRQNGLFRLLNQYKETGEHSEAVRILENFRDSFLPLASRRVRSFDRMNKYRDWLYQNVAAFLAETYDVLVWEGQLNLKKMAESRKDLNKVKTVADYEAEKIRRKSAKYRNFASLYGFRDYLKKAFAKRGKPVIDGVTAYSTRKCSECGEITEKFHNLEFVCPNGHNFDRDFNAAQNLLSQVEGVFIKGEKLEIPASANRNLSLVLRVVGRE